MEDYLGMADSLTSSITRVLMESHDTDLSGKFSLFTLYSDNSSVLHIFEDEETFEAMKYKFSSDDNIKRLGASRLPENTTFKKLSEGSHAAQEGFRGRERPQGQRKILKPTKTADASDGGTQGRAYNQLLPPRNEPKNRSVQVEQRRQTNARMNHGRKER